MGVSLRKQLVESTDRPNLRAAMCAGTKITNVGTTGSDAYGTGNYVVATRSLLYGFNGSTWDRLRCDELKNLQVAVGTASYKLTGTTTDSYADALVWSTAYYFLHKTIIIKNTHASNSLDYRVYVRAKSDGADYLETSGTLAAGDVVKIVLNNWYNVVKVQVKSTTAGAAATYRIDYGGMRG